VCPILPLSPAENFFAEHFAIGFAGFDERVSGSMNQHGDIYFKKGY
jgi:hypothetical protein